MFIVSIKKRNFKVISREPYKVEYLPTKWQIADKADSLSELTLDPYSLYRALEKGEIIAFKIEER